MVYTGVLAEDATELVSKIAFATDGRVNLASVDFTLAPEAQAMVKMQDLAKLRKMCWEVLKEVYGVYDEYGNERRLIAGVGVSQYWHSRNPFKGFFPHFHMTVLDVFYDRKEGSFGRVNLYLEPERLQLLKDLWRNSFEARYGRTTAKLFDVRYRYSHGQGRLNHRLTYSFRRVVIDCYKKTLKTGPKVKVDVAWMQQMLLPPKNWKAIQWFGYLSDGVKASFLKKLGIGFEKKSVRDREKRKVKCNICGNDLYCCSHGIPYDELSKDKECKVLAFPKTRRVSA